ncbi:MAG: ABC transporter permease [Candidatus Latescibacteria bacterium]|nr:ABC transporter permease [Candidatus Latescibacterota bacterium]
MLNYILHRIFLMIPTLIGITVISFSIMHLAPGDPVDLFLGGAAGGEGLSADRQKDIEKTRQALRKQLGLDQPLHIQYTNWVTGLILKTVPLDDLDQMALLADDLLRQLTDAERAALVRLSRLDQKQQFLTRVQQFAPDEARELARSSFWEGRTFNAEGNYVYRGAGIELFLLGDYRCVTLDFGRSFKDNQPVIDRILKRLPITLEINVIAIIVAYIIGLPLGILQAIKQNTTVDRTLTTGTFVLWSMPTFWVGMLLIIFFCNREFFYWFPASGIQSLEASNDWSLWRKLSDHTYHMFLPVLTSTYISFATISRFMRTSMLENLRQDYVRTARAKGLPEKVVVLRHVYRNSLIPIVTTSAGLLPTLIAGSLFIETIFTIPGMGLLGFESVLNRDYPMVLAIFTISSILSLLGILVSDVLLKVVDPRISFDQLQG